MGGVPGDFWPPEQQGGLVPHTSLPAYQGPGAGGGQDSHLPGQLQMRTGTVGRSSVCTRLPCPLRGAFAVHHPPFVEWLAGSMASRERGREAAGQVGRWLCLGGGPGSRKPQDTRGLSRLAPSENPEGGLGGPGAEGLCAGLCSWGQQGGTLDKAPQFMGRPGWIREAGWSTDAPPPRWPQGTLVQPPPSSTAWETGLGPGVLLQGATWVLVIQQGHPALPGGSSGDHRVGVSSAPLEMLPGWGSSATADTRVCEPRGSENTQQNQLGREAHRGMDARLIDGGGAEGEAEGGRGSRGRGREPQADPPA